MADVSLYAMVAGGVAGLVWGVAWGQGRVLVAVQVVRRFIWLMAMGYALRGVCLFGTILPPSNPRCLYVERRSWRDILVAVPGLLSGSAHTCSDKIFSGHTLVATLLAAFWFRLCGNTLGRIYAAANWTLMVSCSLAGRHHYTVDIVVGCIVAALLFHVYHLVLRVVMLEQDTDQQLLFVDRRVRAIISYMDGLDLRANSEEQPSVKKFELTVV
jgi:hypothetical protein